MYCRACEQVGLIPYQKNLARYLRDVLHKEFSMTEAVYRCVSCLQDESHAETYLIGLFHHPHTYATLCKSCRRRYQDSVNYDSPSHSFEERENDRPGASDQTSRSAEKPLQGIRG
jgi:hypothetical protein